ncbi:lens epithelial cell protein LEP503 [Molossus nigricans]
MRPEGVGTVLIKGPRGSSHTLRAAAHMQARTQPLAQVLPFSFGGALRDAGLQVPVVKGGARWKSLQRTLKEVAYILLCCWCIKKLLD